MLSGDLFCWNRVAAQLATTHYDTTLGQVSRVQITKPSTNPGNSAPVEFSFSYIYRVKNHIYNGNLYSYVEPTPPTDMTLPAGKTVSVFYNPNNPAEAVLFRELAADDFGKIAQLVLINFMVFSLLLFWARRRALSIFSPQKIWQS